MKSFRKKIIEEPNSQFKYFVNQGDFFSLSALRDLLFHVQEHQFNIPLIHKLLDQYKLQFIGFDLREKHVEENFHISYPDKSDLYDLKKWHSFEKENPDTFIGMYQFWVRKMKEI